MRGECQIPTGRLRMRGSLQVGGWRLAAEAVERGQDSQICIELLPRNHRDKTQQETRLVRALWFRTALC